MNKHLLFSYGTLQLEKVQMETFGRLLKGSKDSLSAYRLEEIEITDSEVLNKSEQTFHPIAKRSENPEDKIEGTIFEISEEELVQSDAYEVDDYKRVSERFDSGKEAWIYVSA